jgi:probable F420-dependent oxidoreductase
LTVQLSLFFRPYQIPANEHLSVCLDVARAADDAGFHSITFGDHLMLGPDTSAYPYGQFLHRAESAWPEPLTTLAAMAGVTKNLILSTGILLAPLRPPLLLSKTIATLDVLSKGRVQLALGVGWQKAEYEAQGFAWEERYRLLDENVAACRAVWGEQPVDYESAHLKLADAYCLPRPEQARIPLLMGLKMTPKNAERMARLGDGWCPVGIDAQEVRQGVDQLAAAVSAARRSMEEQHIKVGLGNVMGPTGTADVSKTLEAAPEYLEAGATIITVTAPAAPDTMKQIYDFIEQAGRWREDFIGAST